MIQKLLFALLFGYYKVLIETRGPESAMLAAKGLTYMSVSLLFLNLLFWVLPNSLMDSIIPWVAPFVIGAIAIFFATDDEEEMRIALANLNKASFSIKILISIGSFLTLPGFYALIMHQIFR
ncbi:hypothetical protein [Hymenobacter tenuis]